MSDIQTEITPEQRIMRRYQELGKIIKEATEERENIKDTELVPMMLDDGIQFEVDGQYMRFEYVELTKFDHKAARANGDISDEVWKRYTSVEISRRLFARKVQDEMALRAELQVLEAQAKVTKEARVK